MVRSPADVVSGRLIWDSVLRRTREAFPKALRSRGGPPHPLLVNYPQLSHSLGAEQGGLPHGARNGAGKINWQKKINGERNEINGQKNEIIGQKNEISGQKKTETKIGGNQVNGEKIIGGQNGEKDEQILDYSYAYLSFHFWSRYMFSRSIRQVEFYFPLFSPFNEHSVQVWTTFLKHIFEPLGDGVISEVGEKNTEKIGEKKEEKIGEEIGKKIAKKESKIKGEEEGEKASEIKPELKGEIRGEIKGTKGKSEAEGKFNETTLVATKETLSIGRLGSSDPSEENTEKLINLVITEATHVEVDSNPESIKASPLIQEIPYPLLNNVPYIPLHTLLYLAKILADKNVRLAHAWDQIYLIFENYFLADILLPLSHNHANKTTSLNGREKGGGNDSNLPPSVFKIMGGLEVATIRAKEGNVGEYSVENSVENEKKISDQNTEAKNAEDLILAHKNRVREVEAYSSLLLMNEQMSRVGYFKFKIFRPLLSTSKNILNRLLMPNQFFIRLLDTLPDQNTERLLLPKRGEELFEENTEKNSKKNLKDNSEKNLEKNSEQLIEKNRKKNLEMKNEEKLPSISLLNLIADILIQELETGAIRPLQEILVGENISQKNNIQNPDPQKKPTNGWHSQELVQILHNFARLNVKHTLLFKHITRSVNYDISLGSLNCFWTTRYIRSLALLGISHLTLMRHISEEISFQHTCSESLSMYGDPFAHMIGGLKSSEEKYDDLYGPHMKKSMLRGIDVPKKEKDQKTQNNSEKIMQNNSEKIMQNNDPTIIDTPNHAWLADDSHIDAFQRAHGTFRAKSLFSHHILLNSKISHLWSANATNNGQEIGQTDDNKIDNKFDKTDKKIETNGKKIETNDKKIDKNEPKKTDENLEMRSEEIFKTLGPLAEKTFSEYINETKAAEQYQQFLYPTYTQGVGYRHLYFEHLTPGLLPTLSTLPTCTLLGNCEDQFHRQGAKHEGKCDKNGKKIEEKYDGNEEKYKEKYDENKVTENDHQKATWHYILQNEIEPIHTPAIWQKGCTYTAQKFENKSAFSLGQILTIMDSFLLLKTHHWGKFVTRVSDLLITRLRSPNIVRVLDPHQTCAAMQFLAHEHAVRTKGKHNKIVGYLLNRMVGMYVCEVCEEKELVRFLKALVKWSGSRSEGVVCVKKEKRKIKMCIYGGLSDTLPIEPIERALEENEFKFEENIAKFEENITNFEENVTEVGENNTKLEDNNTKLEQNNTKLDKNRMSSNNPYMTRNADLFQDQLHLPDILTSITGQNQPSQIRKPKFILQILANHVLLTKERFSLKELASACRSMAYLGVKDAYFFDPLILHFRTHVNLLDCQDIANIKEGLNKSKIENRNLFWKMGIRYQNLQASVFSFRNKGVISRASNSDNLNFQRLG